VRSKKQPDGERTFVDVARRAQLVQCTIDAIAEVGFEHASLAEIAKRAGISKGAIFYHFANRDELIDAAFTEVITAGANYILPRVQAATTPTEQLHTYIRAFVDGVTIDPRVVTVLLAIGQHLTDEKGLPRLLRDTALQEMAIAPMEDILRRGQESGEFGEFTVRTMALSLRATLEAIPSQLIAYPGLDIEAYREDLITHFDRACLIKKTRRR
jgi:AcrR family transcriptional regulator